MLDQTIEDVTKALAAIRDGAPYSTSDIYAGTLLVLVENADYAPDNGLDPYMSFETPVRTTAAGAGLEQMPLDKFFADYLIPHAAQADFEGDYVKALVLREAIRRLSDTRNGSL
jgi:hypothetical protein